MILRLLIISLFVFSQSALAQIGPDHYRFVAQQNLTPVTDIAVVGNTLFLLTPRGLRSADLESPGIELGTQQRLRLETAFDGIRTLNDQLYIWSRDGSTGRIDNPSTDQLTILKSQLPDSILAITTLDDYVIIPHGYVGLGVYRKPTTASFDRIQLIERGVHYTDVVSDGNLLVALDDYNGIEVYHLEADSLAFTGRALSASPLKHLTMTENHIAASDGSRLLQIWEIGSGGTIIDKRAIELEFAVSALASRQGSFFIGGSGGELALLRQGDTESLVLLSTGLRVERLELKGDDTATEVILLDPLSSLATYELADARFSQKHRLALAHAPSAIGFESALPVIANSEGIFRLQNYSGELIPSALWQGGMIITDITSSDSLFFAVSAPGQIIAAYSKRVGKLHLLVADALTTIPQEVHFVSTASDEIHLAVVSQQSISMTSFNSETLTFTELWSLTVPFAISAADFTGDALVTISEQGDLYFATFDPEDGPISIPVSATLNLTPRDLLLRDSHLALAHSDGLSIYQIDRNAGRIQHLLSPIGVREATSLAFDDLTATLLIGGNDGVRYTGFHDPAEIGVIYSIPGTGSVRGLAFSGGFLLAVSNSALQLFELSPHLARDPEGPGNSISASQFYPNPFNNESGLQLTLNPQNVGKPIRFEIVNVLGQRVWHETTIVTSTEQRFTWSGDSNTSVSTASGVYFFRAITLGESGGDILVRKLVYLK